MSAELRYCFRCGRAGTRQFVRFEHSWACRGERACALRRRRWMRGFHS